MPFRSIPTVPSPFTVDIRPGLLRREHERAKRIICMLSEELLKILCCPLDHGALVYKPEENTLTCKQCGKVYRIKDDIPIMLPDNETAQP